MIKVFYKDILKVIILFVEVYMGVGGGGVWVRFAENFSMVKIYSLILYL